MVEYNKDSNSDDDDKDVKFVDIDILYNKPSLQQLANDSIIYTKKKQVFTTDDKDDKLPKP